MTAVELTGAMRHGSTNPMDQRGSGDLGRFGLGLKTASLSQARKLTVISRKGGITSARRWDMDFVRDKGQWLVVVPEEAELEDTPLFKRLASQVSGTLVVWQDLDRLTASARDPQREMTTKMEGLFEHLALVFHRFTQKEGGHSAVAISVNGLALPPRDPFLGANPYRQVLEGQTINHSRGMVQVSPFILPPVSNLSNDEIELAGGREGLRGTQGFYVYRGRRLVIWGTWFKLVPKQEFYKLTRIKVDIPNSFDELWALDIKKSAAYPPDVIRDRLKLLIPHFATKSKIAIQYPGRTSTSSIAVPLWNRIEPRHGHFTYQVNVDHPLIARLSTSLDSSAQRHLQMILEFLGTSIPFESIYADMCADQRRGQNTGSLEELVEMAQSLLEVTNLDIESVLKIDPLGRYPEQHSAIKEKLEHV